MKHKSGDVWLATVYDEPGAEPEVVELCEPFEGLLDEGEWFMYRFGVNEPTVAYNLETETGWYKNNPQFRVELHRRLYRRGEPL